MKLLSAFACLLVVTAAYAADDRVIEKPLITQTLDGFQKESGAIRDEIKPGGRYEFLKEADRLKVEARLSTIEDVLQKHADQNGLNSNDKLALINAQEEVNSILNHNDANRLICESRAPVGSNLPVKTCRTYGEIEREHGETGRLMHEKDGLSPDLRNGFGSPVGRRGRP
jgi:hypothetical protein